MPIDIGLTLDDLTCGECNIPFALEASHLATLKRTGKLFYCPNGHNISYGKNETDRLRAEKLQLQSQLDYANQRIAAKDDTIKAKEKAITVHKGRATRFKNERDRIKDRIANGVCPCCNRHFVNVERHMTTQHPNFTIPSED